MTIQRPKWIDDLLQDFGLLIGFDDFTFGETTAIDLAIDDLPLVISHEPGSSALLIRSPLQLPVGQPLATLTMLHAANMDSLGAGMGIIACDIPLGSWVWADRIPLAGLTAPHLLDHFENALKAIRFWHAEVARLIPATEADTAPAISATDVLFRL